MFVAFSDFVDELHGLLLFLRGADDLTKVEELVGFAMLG